MNVSSGVSFSEMSLFQSLISGDRRPNVMIIAAGHPVESIVDQFRTICRPPYICCELPGILDLRGCETGTILLHDVAELTTGQQIALFDWLNVPRRDIQIISVTRSPLHPRLVDGGFLEGLFYRLNTLSFTAQEEAT